MLCGGVSIELLPHSAKLPHVRDLHMVRCQRNGGGARLLTLLCRGLDNPSLRNVSRLSLHAIATDKQARPIRFPEPFRSMDERFYQAPSTCDIEKRRCRDLKLAASFFELLGGFAPYQKVWVAGHRLPPLSRNADFQFPSIQRFRLPGSRVTTHGPERVGCARWRVHGNLRDV